MRRRSRPPASPGSRVRLRLSFAFAAAFAGTILVGLVPATATAAGMRMAPGAMDPAMTHAAMSHAVLAQATPAPQASMSPLPQPKNVEAGPELRKVLESILCQCGCNLTVYACEGTMVCDVSAAMRADAERMLASGLTADEAVEAFAADYGEGVLAAPTKRGFNLTAWILPFVVLGAGGLLVVLALRTWRPKTAAEAGPPIPQVEEKYLAEVEKELEQEE